MRKSWILVLALAVAAPVVASEIGQIKVAKVAVQVERDGQRVAATVGMPIRTADVLVTGADGSAGVTFSDNSLVSVGPNSVFAIDKYRFDSTTHAGEFQGSLRKGKLAAVSGKMVQQTPESMKFRTPSSVMAVRGTEFVVQVDEPAASAFPLTRPQPMRLAAAALLVLAAAGCAHSPDRHTGPELFAVIPGEGGHVGTIVVRADGPEQVLDEAYEASRVSPDGRPTAAKLSAAEKRMSTTVPKDREGPFGAVTPGRVGQQELFITSNWRIVRAGHRPREMHPLFFLLHQLS